MKLASNENPFGCSARVTEALTSLASQYALYPDGYAFKLRTKIAEHLGVKAEQLLFGSGLDEVIQMISRALLHEGTNVVMANPTFHNIITMLLLKEQKFVKYHLKMVFTI